MNRAKNTSAAGLSVTPGLFALAVVCGCVMPPPHPDFDTKETLKETSAAAPDAIRVSSNDYTFVSVRNSTPQTPQAEERQKLQQIASLLQQALQLSMRGQQAFSNSAARVSFDYQGLGLDLQAVALGIAQYLATDLRTPRLPTGANQHSLQGDYMKVSN